MKKRYGTLVLSCLVSGYVQADAPVAKKAASKAQQLKSPFLQLIDKGLYNNPSYIQAIMALRTQAAKSLSELQKHGTTDEAAYIANFMATIVEPNKTFFQYLHSSQGFLRAMLRQSLNNLGYEPPILNEFFHCEKKDIDTFFENRLKTIEDLKHAGKEFITFSRDLLHSLSPETKKFYNEWHKQNYPAASAAADKPAGQPTPALVA